MEPFKTKEFKTPGFFENLFKKEPEINLVIEANNKLSSSDIDNLSENLVTDLLQKYNIKKLSRKVNAEMVSLMTNFLTFHLGNPESPTNNYAAALKMQKFLHLDNSVFQEVYKTIASSKTKALALDMLSDNIITDQEENHLKEWKVSLNISDDFVSKIFQPIQQTIFNNFINQITEDNKISPTEEKNLYQLISDLKTQVNISTEKRSAIDRMKLMWRIENDTLPPITPDILLPKNELCFFTTGADLYETRKITKSYSYAGPTFRVKIMKGVYYRAGNLRVRPQSEDVLTKIDSGSIYITNKRILFTGSKQNKPIRFNQIINFEVYSDGIEISKESGKNPVFVIKDNVDLAGAYLARCVKDTLA